jgi:hypothetical protein
MPSRNALESARKRNVLMSSSQASKYRSPARRAQGVQLVEGEPLDPGHRLALSVAIWLIDNPAERRVGSDEHHP